MDVQPIITNLTDVAGVSGAAIFDDSGHCMGHHLFPPYEPVLLWEMLRELRVATDGYAGMGVGDQISDSLLVFEHGKILTRRADPFELVALTTANANLAVLAVAFNVAMLRLHQSGGPGWNASASSRGFSSAGVPAYASQREPSARYDLPPDHGNAHRSSSRFPAAPHNGSAPSGGDAYNTKMSWSQTQDRIAGAVGVKVMRHLLMVTQRYMGQDAQSVLERELRSVGATPQTLTSSQFADVIRSVSRLLQLDQRENYIADVLGDRSRR